MPAGHHSRHKHFLSYWAWPGRSDQGLRECGRKPVLSKVVESVGKASQRRSFELGVEGHILPEGLGEENIPGRVAQLSAWKCGSERDILGKDSGLCGNRELGGGRRVESRKVSGVRMCCARLHGPGCGVRA